MPIKIKRKNGKVTRYKNAEYIPLFYFLPKSLLYKCGELPFRISRYPYELFTDWKQIELIESDQFALLMYDAFHYLVWEYMGLNVGREIYFRRSSGLEVFSRTVFLDKDNAGRGRAAANRESC